MKNYWLSTHLIYLPTFSHRIKVEVGPLPKNTLTYPSCMVFSSVTELRASARIGRNAILTSFVNALLSISAIKAPEGFNVECYVKRNSPHSSIEQQCKVSALSKRFEVRVRFNFFGLHIICSTPPSPSPAENALLSFSLMCAASTSTSTQALTKLKNKDIPQQPPFKNPIAGVGLHDPQIFQSSNI